MATTSNLAKSNPNIHPLVFVLQYRTLLGNAKEFWEFAKYDNVLSSLTNMAYMLSDNTQDQLEQNKDLQTALDKTQQMKKQYENAKQKASQLAENAINEGISKASLQQCRESLANLVEQMKAYYKSLREYIDIAENLLPN